MVPVDTTSVRTTIQIVKRKSVAIVTRTVVDGVVIVVEAEGTVDRDVDTDEERRSVSYQF